MDKICLKKVSVMQSKPQSIIAMTVGPHSNMSLAEIIISKKWRWVSRGDVNDE